MVISQPLELDSMSITAPTMMIAMPRLLQGLQLCRWPRNRKLKRKFEGEAILLLPYSAILGP
jgi:hypothetical protein